MVEKLFATFFLMFIISLTGIKALPDNTNTIIMWILIGGFFIGLLGCIVSPFLLIWF